MLPEFNFSAIFDYEIGKDFVFKWEQVMDFAKNTGINFATFITMPIAAKLTDKKLVRPVLFLYTPLNDKFVITMCSKHNVNFMNPLLKLPGRVEYGESDVRPIATPIVYWDGAEVFHTFPVYGQETFHNYIADYGNGFGCTVTESDEETYKDVTNNPTEYFDYFAVPNTSEQKKKWEGKTFTIKYALCRMHS